MLNSGAADSYTWQVHVHDANIDVDILHTGNRPISATKRDI